MLAWQRQSILSSPDTLAKTAVALLRHGSAADAAEAALFFAARHGLNHPQAYALCGVALARHGQWRASFECWDRVVRNYPQKINFLESALRQAWDAQADFPEAAAYAEKWLKLLELVFAVNPGPAILSLLSARGWRGKGSLGTNAGRLRGWLWLDKGEKIYFSSTLKGINPALKMLGADDRHMLYGLDEPLPNNAGTFFIELKDAGGRHVRGSPLVCSPPMAARARNLGKGRFAEKTVTIIIPVYDDRESALACLASVFASLKHNRLKPVLLAVWDCGPNIKLHEDLLRLQKKGRLTCLATPRNMGFLGCVNFALAHVPHGNVILLNSDTLVHGNWIDRMARAAAAADAATVTALGSDAEHVSFPSIGNRGKVRRPWQVRILDEACARLDADLALREIPVGVGFCMAVTRRALNMIGGLDGLEVFRGYGEEVDYSLRAAAAGLKNYAAMNIYVAHLGGRSFGLSKKALVAQNNDAIRARFPGYGEDYDLFLMSDPLRGAREQISRFACASLPFMPFLDIYPWTSMRLPPFSEKSDMLEKYGDYPVAALFLLPAGKGSGRAMLRIAGEISLEDMSFRLPEDMAALESVLASLAFGHARLHTDSAAIKSVAKQIGLADRLSCPEGADQASQLPRLEAADSRAYLAAPPQGSAGWKRLCAFADRNADACIYTHALNYLWGGVPRPLNLVNLPDLEDLRPLAPAAFIFTENGQEILAWRQWLAARHCAELSMYVLESA